MNWLNFLIFVLLYAASCIPMVAAGHTDDLRTRTTMLIVDGLLTVTSFIYLWFSFPETFYSLSAVVVWLSISSGIGVWMRDRGYDPYGEIIKRKEG